MVNKVLDRDSTENGGILVQVGEPGTQPEQTHTSKRVTNIKKEKGLGSSKVQEKVNGLNSPSISNGGASLPRSCIFSTVSKMIIDKDQYRQLIKDRFLVRIKCRGSNRRVFSMTFRAGMHTALELGDKLKYQLLNEMITNFTFLRSLAQEEKNGNLSHAVLIAFTKLRLDYLYSLLGTVIYLMPIDIPSEIFKALLPFINGEIDLIKQSLSEYLSKHELELLAELEREIKTLQNVAELQEQVKKNLRVTNNRPQSNCSFNGVHKAEEEEVSGHGGPGPTTVSYFGDCESEITESINQCKKVKGKYCPVHRQQLFIPKWEYSTEEYYDLLINYNPISDDSGESCTGYSNTETSYPTFEQKKPMEKWKRVSIALEKKRMLSDTGSEENLQIAQ